MFRFKSKTSFEAVAMKAHTDINAPLQVPRLSDNAFFVFRAMNVEMYASLLDAAQAELKRWGYRPVYKGHRDAVSLPAKVAVGMVIYAARRNHLSPREDGELLFTSLVESERDGTALVWAEGVLDALAQTGIHFRFELPTELPTKQLELSTLVSNQLVQPHRSQ